ncbi:IS200/IS605 family transposase [Streptosporangium sp. NPDC049644]|uniref:IS200/IS605 family transposase n=1 Tax=Streptosporangium sp. NPDC049644 TaxID=3155507 RepID=UPI00344A4592
MAAALTAHKVASSAAACSGVGRSLTCTTSFTAPKLSFGPCHRDRNPTCAGAEPLSARCTRIRSSHPGIGAGSSPANRRAAAPLRRNHDRGVRLVEFNGERDHVRLLVGCPPKVVLAALVDSLKGISARLLRKEYPAVHRYLRGGRLRSPSYVAASCGGALLSLIKKYIENQERPDQRPDVHNSRTGKRFLPGVNARGSLLDNAETWVLPERFFTIKLPAWT